MRKSRHRITPILNGHPPPEVMLPVPVVPPVGEPGRVPTVGFSPVRCPLCRMRELACYGASRNGLVLYYACRRCLKRFKAVDVSAR